MNSIEIKKQIDTLQEEIATLAERKKSVEDELKKESDTIASISDGNEDMSNVERLQSQKSFFEDTIQQKQKTLGKLEEQLQSVTDEESAKQKFQTIVSHASNAEELEESYRRKVQEINAFLEKEIPALLEIKREWRRESEQFIRSADNHSPGFLEATRLSFARQNKRDELKAEQLMETLKDEGINFDSAMRATILESRYYSIPLKPVKSFDGLAFSEAILNMTQQRNIPELVNEE